MARVITRTGRLMMACALAAAGAVALPGTALAGLPGASRLLTRAPYLTDLTRSSVQVSWATMSQSRGVVEFGPPGHCAAHTVVSPHLGSPITVNNVREFQNSVQIAGLGPFSRYCYRVAADTSPRVDLLGSDPSPQFTTLRRGLGPSQLTFDVVGDWGDTTNGGVNNGSLNRNQADIDALIARGHAQFVISAGDTGYPGGTQTDYGDLDQTGVNVSAVFGPHYWAVPGESIPYFSVSGNHGLNSNFLSIWPETTTAAGSNGTYSMVAYPSIDGSRPGSYPTSYYAFTTGRVRFYMLDAAWGDTNTGTADGGTCGRRCATYQVDHDAHWTAQSAEYQWLKRDLAAHPGGLKFAFFHYPLYSDSATQSSDLYLDNIPGHPGNLESLLHSNGVRLVFNGHAHDYQRNIAGPGGVISYVTGGGGGQVQPVAGHGCSRTDAYAIGWSYGSRKGSACGAAPKPTSDAQVYNFLRVTVAGLRVTVEPINALGQAFDVQSYSF
jgi:Calcineurin-like phosphoesterase